PRRSPPLSTGVRRDGRYATRIAPAAVSHGGGRARIPPGSGGHPEPRRPLHRKDPVSGRGRTAVKELRMRRGEPLHLPSSGRDLLLRSGKRALKLTNLDKLFFPEAGVTKRDLLQYYADVAPALVPHLRGRAMVMKRYPNGIHGKYFFMKRTPAGAPEWIRRCSSEHGSGSVSDFPVASDLLSLLWLVNLRSIDLNPWYSRCDDTDRP